MALSDIAKRFGKVTADNSPAILTAIGVAGCITTAVLTGKASMRAQQIIAENEVCRDESDALDLRKKAELTWHLYIPAACMGGITIASIIMANRIGTRRAAALAAAYTMGKDALEDYKDKVAERLGPKKTEALNTELAQDRVRKNPPKDAEIIPTGGDQLCYEEFTGRYFLSTIEKLHAAVNTVNHKVINSYYASLTDFYDAIGLPSTPASEEFGWNSDKLMELTITAVLIDDRPCISVGYVVEPIRDYYRIC